MLWHCRRAYSSWYSFPDPNLVTQVRLFVRHKTGPCPLAALRVLKSIFIYLRRNLAQVRSCRAWLVKFRAGSFLKLKFYRGPGCQSNLQTRQAPSVLPTPSASSPVCSRRDPSAPLCPGAGESPAGTSAPVCLLLHPSTSMLALSFGFHATCFMQPGLRWLFMPSLRGGCIYQPSWQQV